MIYKLRIKMVLKFIKKNKIIYSKYSVIEELKYKMLLFNQIFCNIIKIFFFLFEFFKFHH